MAISEAKRRRLQALSTPSGIFEALAVDQRKSLRGMIAEASGTSPDAISDGQLAEFKTAVTERLTPHASAVLIDPEFGSAAFGARAPGCGLLATYEADGYDNPRPNRMLALLPNMSVRRLRDLGADGIKILLSYTPFGDRASNDEKCAMIERIGNECEALDMPFFLEPVCYDPAGTDPRSAEFARRKPEMVIGIMQEFSRDVYKVDVLKVEFPVNVSYVEGNPMYQGTPVHSRAEALELFRRADAAAARPYIYLSAGVTLGHFVESLAMAAESGARFSGILCGRATWQNGIAGYARGGRAALDAWLATEGVRNIQSVNDAAKAATRWDAREC